MSGSAINAHSVFNSLSPESAPFTKTEAEEASQQLLFELAKAAKEGMVSTRSHDHVLQSVDTNSALEPGSSSPNDESRKRKWEGEVDGTPRLNEKKRKITEAAVAVAVVIEEPQTKLAKHSHSNQMQNDLIGAKDMESKNPSPLTPNAGRNTEAGRTEDATPSLKQGKLANRPKPGESIEMIGTSKSGYEQPDVIQNAIPENHKNDDSKPLNKEEQSKPARGIDERTAELDADLESDGDTPEEATTLAGHDRVGTAAAKATKFAAQEAAARKARRREHEQRMTAQAEGAKKRVLDIKEGSGRLKKDRIGRDMDQASKMKNSTKTPLPALLPDDVLNAVPTIRAPTLSALPVKPAANTKKLLFLDERDKPPKDLVRGNTKIRILQEDRMILPPKSSAKGKSIREKWLLGQRGLGPKRQVPRMKAVGGFVRKVG